MNFLQRIFKPFQEKRSHEVADVNDSRLLEWLGIEPGEINMQGKNALKEATVYSCIRILSEGIGKLPLKVFQDADGIRKATEHPLFNLLKLRPNPFMTTADFFKTLETQRNLYGNAYASIEFDPRFPGRVTGLYPMDATRVKIYVDDVGCICDSKSKMWYVVHLPNGEQRRLEPDEVLHFKALTVDGVAGVSPLDYLKLTAENAAAGTRYINNFFKQGLQTKGIIHYTGDLNPEARETFRKKFEEMASGLKNSHRVSLLPMGYQFQPLQLTLADAQFLENTELSIRQIAAAFGVKMHQLNNLERATHHNAEEMQRQFYVETLLPVLTNYEQELTFKLLMESELKKGFYCKFNVDVMLRPDAKTRAEFYRIMVQGGIMTANECRAKEELGPLPGGDQLLVNGSMVPINQAGVAYKGGGGS